MHSARRMAVVTVAAVGAVGLAGCGSDTQTQADAEARACDAVASIQKALQGVAGL